MTKEDTYKLVLNDVKQKDKISAKKINKATEVISYLFDVYKISNTPNITLSIEGNLRVLCKFIFTLQFPKDSESFRITFSRDPIKKIFAIDCYNSEKSTVRTAIKDLKFDFDKRVIKFINLSDNRAIELNDDGLVG